MAATITFAVLTICTLPGVLSEPALGGVLVSRGVRLAGEAAKTGVLLTADTVSAGTQVGKIGNNLENELTKIKLDIGHDTANTTLKVARKGVEKFSEIGGAGVDPIPEKLAAAIDFAQGVADNVANRASGLENGRHRLVDSALNNVNDFTEVAAENINSKIDSAVSAVQNAVNPSN